MVAVRSILTSLRTRSGLGAERLRSTNIDVEALLQLSMVRRHAHLQGTGELEAVPEVLSRAAEYLPATTRLIVDAALCLRMFDESGPPGVDLDRLYASDLTERRRYLIRNWGALHTALGVTRIPPAPTVRTLREAPELSAFTALAEILIAGAVPEPPGRDTVTIIGDGVIDYIWVVEHFPKPGTSIAGGFTVHPGGKGLNRAVGLARLGLDARLLTVVGDDAAGAWICKYLIDNHVDTSLIKIAANASSPATTLTQTLNGEYSAIYSKPPKVSLTDADLDSAATRQAITAAKAVVVTFEQSAYVLEALLRIMDDLARVARSRRPWLIVNASPPWVLTRVMHQYLHVVDYIIGRSDELRQLWPESTCEQVIERLLGFGVGAVCVIDHARSSVHRNGWPTVELSRFSEVLPGSAGTVAAFSAALTYRLVRFGRTADNADFEWATAAMAASEPTVNVPDAMPSLDRIEMIATRANIDAE